RRDRPGARGEEAERGDGHRLQLQRPRAVGPRGLRAVPRRQPEQERALTTSLSPIRSRVVDLAARSLLRSRTIRPTMDVGVDVGGTFTDFVGFRGREVVTAKFPSTPDPSRAVVDGMRELGAGDMAHGTTIATNAILQRKGARTVFVTTAGFEDLLIIGRQDRPNLYDFHVTRASPPVDSEMCLGADERVDARGRPLRPLTELRAAIRKDFFVMKSGGGVAVHSAVARRPVDLVLSGPAGGVAAGAALSRGKHSRNFVTFDMGGTSADFSALPKGEPTWTTDAVIDTFPIAIPVIDIESVGAGGGSLAWIDPGGALRVGPESAGATPGPMAYGAGGSQVTVTDADLVGGSLGPSLLGGRLPLDRSLSTKGIEALASTLHLSRDEAILGVQRVVEASMAKAMRLVLARRGLDPRDFALLAFGGAGPM